MTGIRTVACVALAALLAACTSPQAQQRAQMANMAEEVLERAGSIGDPGRVAAADFASARRELEAGVVTAYAEYAAPGALVHTQRGLVLDEALPGIDDPAQADSRAPNTIWTSCDGTLAVTFGRFSSANGLLGSYLRAWELQDDRSYKWIYDLGALDNPQPAAPEPQEELPEGAIVVPGMTSINGMVADCPVPAGEPLPQIPISLLPQTQGDGVYSEDRTLRVDWFHAASGRRSVIVNWVREGEVQRAVEFEAPFPPYVQ